MNNWLSMGGYGVFVWGAYGFSFGILLINILWSRFKRRQILTKLKKFLSRDKI